MPNPVANPKVAVCLPEIRNRLVCPSPAKTVAEDNHQCDEDESLALKDRRPRRCLSSRLST